MARSYKVDQCYVRELKKRCKTKVMPREDYMYIRETWLHSRGTELMFIYDADAEIYKYWLTNNKVRAPLKAIDIIAVPLDLVSKIKASGRNLASLLIEANIYTNFKDETNIKGYNVRKVDYIGEFLAIEVKGVDERTDVFKVSPTLFSTLVIGDKVVVETGAGLQIREIIFKQEISSTFSIETMELRNKACCWVVDKIDMTEQEKRAEATTRRDYIMRELEERKKALEERQVWEMLAERDPEAKKLLDEMRALDPTLSLGVKDARD